MKKYFLTCTASALMALGSVSAQTIPNNDFENWTGNEPIGWGTLNSMVAGVSKSTSSHSGTYAAKLETKTYLFQAVPGILTLGEVVVSGFSATIEGGIPFTQRPDSLIGYYKATCASTDEVYMGVALFKWNPATHFADTVATGKYYSPDDLTSWKRFSFPIDYRMIDNPDTVNVLFLSSRKGYAVAGTVLYVDDVSFVYNSTSTVQPLFSDEMAVYPNPAKSSLNITVPESGSLTIYDLTGRTIRELSVTPGTVTLDVSGLNDGIYLLQCKSGPALRSVKFIKKD